MAEALKMPPPAAVAVTAAIPVLEDAVRLLRSAPFGTLLCHWIGSVPLALALLGFWKTITNPRTGDGAVAAQSLALAVLMIWMNCWRSVFAGRLRRQLSGTPGPPWAGRRVLVLIASQAFLGATKPLVLPLSALIVFPLAKAVTFYRTAAVLGDREDLEPFRITRLARQLARIEHRQSWTILTLLLFLGLVASLNLALTLAFLPSLIRMLTGYESVFSRSGVNFITNSLFWLLVAMLTWISFDLFVQAAYCVRAFRAESIGTGEDLRSGLRRVRGAAGRTREEALAGR